MAFLVILIIASLTTYFLTPMLWEASGYAELERILEKYEK